VKVKVCVKVEMCVPAGAYYYYQTEPNKNYEDTLLDVYDYAQKESIPYHYILLDSWW
jgi:alpha-glucosidase (family GH31 glycosyl hydrolase)